MDCVRKLQVIKQAEVKLNIPKHACPMPMWGHSDIINVGGKWKITLTLGFPDHSQKLITCLNHRFIVQVLVYTMDYHNELVTH
jgi:hypothetical protein